VLFLGMRGSGKSTELNKLAATLRDAFEVVRIDVDARLNASEFDIAELVLAVAVEVERHMREEVNKPLEEALLKDIQTWFATVTREKVEERLRVVQAGGEGKVPVAAGFFGSVMGMLKSTSTERRSVVTALQRFPGELVTLCNTLVRSAEAKLGEGRELLLILDNLDRYPPEVVDRALGGGADHVQGLKVCMVLTPPVDLLINPVGPPLTGVYATEVMHVPSIRKATETPGTLSDPGARLLRELLAKRVAVDVLFERGVAERLIELSGGHPRLLLDLTREALLRENGDRLGMDAVDAAVRAQLTLLRDQVNNSGLLRLLVHAYAKQQLGPDQGYLRLLFNRWVFKHNGQDWYAVNPLVLLVPEVSEAIRAADAG